MWSLPGHLRPARAFDNFTYRTIFNSEVSGASVMNCSTISRKIAHQQLKLTRRSHSKLNHHFDQIGGGMGTKHSTWI